MIPFNDENKAKITQVAEDLRGTCKSLDEAFQVEFGEDVDPMNASIELLRHLDDQVMLCDCCGWWVETSDINDAGVCIDCACTEEDDDDR